MQPRSIQVLRHGHHAPPPAERTLRAGPLSLIYSAGDLRSVRFGPREILNRVYVALRDHNWNTIPFTLHNEQIEDGGDRFRITYIAEHRQDGIEFQWQGTIEGGADGAVTFAMDGRALTTFARNRIGFCVLHPAHLAGTICAVEHVDGMVAAGRFPQQISPHQPFFDIRAIRHPVATGIEAEVRMEGDTFEMEDQRNWTDASYKTYCTPLSLPFPVTIEAGTRVRQHISLHVRGALPTVRKTRPAPVRFAVTRRVAGPLPRVGLGLSSVQPTLTPKEVARLRTLHPAHLRVDLHLGAPTWPDELARAVRQAAAIGCDIEAAVHVTDAAETELAEFRAQIDALQPRVARWLVYHEREKGIQARWIETAHRHLQGTSRDGIGAGTNAYFTELNRNPPPAHLLDMVCYSLNPQVHAFDNRSLMETLPIQATTVAGARLRAQGRPIVVSPITLRPRFNPNATGTEADLPHQLPGQVDARQMALFCAAWTVGSLKSMLESGVASVTYYETVGWRGVMECAEGPPLPDHFPSWPGQVFPLYHVLADLAWGAETNVLVGESSVAERITGFVLARGEDRRVVLANLTAEEVEVTLVHGARVLQMRMLDEESVQPAGSEPETFRRSGVTLIADQGETSVRLRPYAIARFDFDRAL